MTLPFAHGTGEKPGRSAQGFTLMETLIVMMIGAIALVFTMNLFDLTNQNQGRTTATAEGTAAQTQASISYAIQANCTAVFGGQALTPGPVGALNTALQDLALDLPYFDSPGTPSAARYIAQRNVTRWGPFTVTNVGIQLLSNPSGRTYTGNLTMTATATSRVPGSQTKAVNVPLTVTLDAGVDTILSCNTTSTGSSDSVPSGAIMAFNLTDADPCPTGWSVFNGLAGRVPLGAGTYTFTDATERADYNWISTNYPGAVVPPGPPSLSYSAQSNGGRLFYRQRVEQMAEHWHYVLKTNAPVEWTNITGAGTGGYWWPDSPPLPPPGWPGAGPFSANTCDMQGYNMVMMAQENQQLPQHSVVGMVRYGKYPPVPTQPGAIGIGFDNTIGINSYTDLFTRCSTTLPPAPPSTTTGGGGGPGACPASGCISGTDPWSVGIIHDPVARANLTYTSTGCTLNRSGTCTPPVYNAFYSQLGLNGGGGGFASQGSEVMPPYYSVKYCVKD